MKKNNLLIWAGALLLNSSCVLAEAPINLDVELATSKDDNLNRSALANDEIESTFYTAASGLGFTHRINPLSFVNYSGRIKYENYADTDGLNNAEAKFSVSYRNKPIAGFNKPTIILDAHVAITDFETDVRDRTEYGFGVMMSAWVTDRMSARVGTSARLRDSDSRVFDTKDVRLFLNSDLILTRKLTTYLTFSYIRGDVVSTTGDTSSVETLHLIRIADDIEPDATFADSELSYRFNATTRVLNGGFNYQMTRRQALDLSFRTVHSKEGSGVDYESSFVNLSYMLRFKL
jgi:hypothetical protein